MHSVFSLLQTALYMIFVQNLVFSGGYGASEAIRMSAKPKRFVPFAVMIAFYSTATALLCRELDTIPEINALGSAPHILLFGGVLTVLYAVTALLLYLLLHPGRKFFNTLGIAALNTMVFAVPLINRQAGFTLLQSAGTGSARVCRSSSRCSWSTSVCGGWKRIPTSRRCSAARPPCSCTLRCSRSRSQDCPAARCSHNGGSHG